MRFISSTLAWTISRANNYSDIVLSVAEMNVEK